MYTPPSETTLLPPCFFFSFSNIHVHAQMCSCQARRGQLRKGLTHASLSITNIQYGSQGHAEKKSDKHQCEENKKVKCALNMWKDWWSIHACDLHLPRYYSPSPAARRLALCEPPSTTSGPETLSIIDFALHLHICVWIINQPTVTA